MYRDKLKDPQELWNEYSEYIDDDIFSLERVAGTSVMTFENFVKLMKKLKVDEED